LVLLLALAFAAGAVLPLWLASAPGQAATPSPPADGIPLRPPG
jgi:hypothetical protein